jgi:formiminoglutamate deiminase
VTTTWWCEQAWLGGPSTHPGVVLTVDGDRLVGVTQDVAEPPLGAERLAGLVLPGLVDAHSHAFHRALRSRTHAGAGSFWTWRDQMYDLAGRLDPERLHRLARAAFAELALAGVTTVGEFHYVHHASGGVPYADPAAMGSALVAAAAEVGLRLTLLDTAYLRSGFDVELAPVQRRFVDRDVAAWAERASTWKPSATLRVGAAIHSVRAVPVDAMQAVAAWARHRDVPLHAHVSEQRAEDDACLAVHGCTPMALLDSVGAISPRFTAVHATQATDDDIRLLGGDGSTCCLCPTTERDLADGIGPAAALVAAGARLAVGSDSHAVVDLFEEARAVELDERLATGKRGAISAAVLLGAATAGGAHSLGWPEAGELAVGRLADVVVLALESPRLAGAEPDHLVDGAVFAATAADVRHVAVGGRWIVRDGAHVTLDVAAELRRSIAGAWA